MTSLVQVPGAGALARVVETPALTREMLSLTHRLDILAPPAVAQQGRIFQFIGPSGGEGATTVVSELARVAAMELGRSAIVLNGCQTTVLTQSERDELVSSLRQLAESGERPTGGSLVEVPFDLPRAYRAALRKPDMELAFFGHLRDAFDMTFVDAPCRANQAETIGMTRLVDGVVLVVEQDSAKRAALELKAAVRDAGGRILGVVMNKQQAHLPVWLSQLLGGIAAQRSARP